MIYNILYITGKALSHARAGPDHGINLPVLEHVVPSGPSMCFRHICALEYPSVALRPPWVFGCFLIDSRGTFMFFVMNAIYFNVA